MRAQILQIILDEIGELRTTTAAPLQGEVTETTRLFGKAGALDSIGLVSLMVAVEQTIEDSFGISISITSDRAMSQTHSPFRSVGALTDWVAQLVKEARPDA